LDESALNGLNENELETLLYLLDKVDRPRVVPNRQQQEKFTYAHPYYAETRNKRTGHHGVPQKKAVDWSDYLGIDKREVKPTEMEETAAAAEAASPSTPLALPDAKDDKEREEILKEFYANMVRFESDDGGNGALFPAKIVNFFLFPPRPWLPT